MAAASVTARRHIEACSRIWRSYPGTFVCGLDFCDPTMDAYCLGQVNLTTCATDYACVPFPSACATDRTCACLQGSSTPLITTCSGNSTTGITAQAAAGDSPTCP
jgi:hypothetical protein